MNGTDALTDRLPVDPDRMMDDLRALDDLTGGSGGASRVAWSPGWDRAREWLTGRLAELEIKPQFDQAGNLWAELPRSATGPVIAVGSHLDSVPQGGWLDGALGVIAALEVMRAAVQSGWDMADLLLVDWADEEGTRFGFSTLGSSIAAGLVDIRTLTDRQDSAGQTLGGKLAQYGIDPDYAHLSSSRLQELDFLLELHIEQGPALEEAGLALGVPTGAVAVERFELTFIGEAAHAGTTPMLSRRDAGLAAAEFQVSVADLAGVHKALATCGVVRVQPGVVTAVNSGAVVSLDLRMKSDEGMRQLVDAAMELARETARRRRVELGVTPVWEVPAVEFDPRIVAAFRASVSEAEAREPLVSGALHDAVTIARAGVPAGMLFVRSARGISHSPEEDSFEADLKAGLRALARAIESLT